jgi:methylated-DNA-protein-cysteine methyltransferase-like protein
VPTRAARTDAEHIAALYQRIYRLIRRVPRGTVATYGQIAELSGLPRGGRVVGYALRVSTPAMGLPWQRIVGKRGRDLGRIAILDPVGGAIQRQLLEAEGVEVSDAGAISLVRFGWLPTDDRHARRPPGKRKRRAHRT